MKRTVIPELLDTDSGTPEEIAASLRDLRGINRRFGGLATTRSLIERTAAETGGRSLTILEVAAGASELASTVRAELKQRGIDIQATLLDRSTSHFDKRSNGFHGVAGDALALPFSEASFDIVCSCLFVHHLSPEEVVRHVNEGLRVCRSAVLINDLVRSRTHLAAVYAGTPLFRSRITRHDAPASVHRAYTPEEMARFLNNTGARKVEISRHFLFRMGVVIWK